MGLIHKAKDIGSRIAKSSLGNAPKEMCDCGHNIYGDNRPFHIGSNPDSDNIIVVSNETSPDPIDINSVFIDEYFYGGAERFVNKEIFDADIFHNFCALCENVVLRDRIILSYDIFQSDFSNQLRNEGVLASTFWPEEATNVLIEKTEDRRIVTGKGDLGFHILMKLGLSKMMGISYTPPIQETVQTEDVLDKLNNHIFKSILMDAYSQLSKGLERDIKLLKEQGRKIDLFIPPITAVMLDRVSRPEDIAEELLNMRKKFTSTRNAFKEYAEKIMDDSLSLKESMNALSSLDRQLNEITKPYELKNVAMLAHWKDLIDIIPDKLRETKWEDLNVKAVSKLLLGLPLELLMNKLRMKETVHLFRLRREFLEISDYNKLVEKVFGKSLQAS